jgi:hypothetical protein
MVERGNRPCAQPICRHRREDHIDDQLHRDDHPCTLCTCSAYVSAPRMVGRRLMWAFSRHPHYGGSGVTYTGG